MMKTRYSSWQTFRFKGRCFLALAAKDNSAHIYNQDFDSYGAWFSIKSFKDHYAKEGEGLNLDHLQDPIQENAV